MPQHDNQTSDDVLKQTPSQVPPWAPPPRNPAYVGPGGNPAEAASLFGHYAEQLQVPAPAPLDIPGQPLSPLPDLRLRMPQIGDSARPVNTAPPGPASDPTLDLLRPLPITTPINAPPPPPTSVGPQDAVSRAIREGMAPRPPAPWARP